MSKNKVAIIVVSIFLAAIGPNLAFLPGPHLLYTTSQILYDGFQLISIPAIVILAPIGVVWFLKERKKKRGKIKSEISTISLLLIILPVTAFLSVMYLADMMRGYSRIYAIDKAQAIITSIENYKKEQNQYPENLQKLIPEYIEEIPSAGIIGIPGFSYEHKGTSYNLRFSQNVILSFNIEVVIYDPNDNHTAKGELQTLYETGRNHWKYYIFD